MASAGAVLDACVMAPAALRDTLLRAASKGLYRLVWSDMILAETERALVDAGLTYAPRAQRLINAMRLAFPDAAVVVPSQTIEAMPNDPKDRHVAAAAVAARVRIIVAPQLQCLIVDSTSALIALVRVILHRFDRPTREPARWALGRARSRHHCHEQLRIFLPGRFDAQR